MKKSLLLLLLLAAVAAAALGLVMWWWWSRRRRQAEPFTSPLSPNMGNELGVINSGDITFPVKKGTGSGGKHAFVKDFKVSSDKGLVVRFMVKFHPGYEWGCKGKVAGLQVGPGASSGGRYSENGASLRLMWGANGGGYAYIYTPKGAFQHQTVPELKKEEKYGQTMFADVFNGSNKALAKDGFHEVDLGIKLNDVKPGTDQAAISSGQAVKLGNNTVYKNGKILFGIDGQQRVQDGIIWRREVVSIQNFGMGVFHGGPCKAMKDSTMSFGEVRQYEWKD